MSICQRAESIFNELDSFSNTSGTGYLNRDGRISASLSRNWANPSRGNGHCRPTSGHGAGGAVGLLELKFRRPLFAVAEEFDSHFVARAECIDEAVQRAHGDRSFARKTDDDVRPS